MQFKSSTIFVWLLMMASTFGTYAWTEERNYHNAKYPGKCYIKPLEIISPGEKFNLLNDCGTVYCNDADGWATYTTCDPELAPPKCKWWSYFDSLFPKCCTEKPQCIYLF